MLALNGYGGKITGGLVSIPGGDHWVGHGRSEARTPLPKWMSPEAWNMWQGPAQHWENNAFIPSIHEPTCWRFNKRYGNGMVTDFGAHEFDEIQRGLGTDLSGPVRVENVKSDLLPDDQRTVFSWAKTFSFDFVYKNGVRINVVQIDKEHGIPRQTVWHTEKGDIGVKARRTRSSTSRRTTTGTRPTSSTGSCRSGSAARRARWGTAPSRWRTWRTPASSCVSTASAGILRRRSSPARTRPRRWRSATRANTTTAGRWVLSGSWLLEPVAKPLGEVFYEPRNTRNTRKYACDCELRFRVFRVFRGFEITSLVKTLEK